MNVVRLIIGDIGGDGHSRTASININTDASTKQLKAAYNKGCALLGFDMIHDLCRDDKVLQADLVSKLQKVGHKFDKFSIDSHGRATMDKNDWVSLFLFVVFKAEPLIYAVPIKNCDATEMYLGGYGLFD